jgi:hypothetical protein
MRSALDYRAVQPWPFVALRLVLCALILAFVAACGGGNGGSTGGEGNGGISDEPPGDPGGDDSAPPQDNPVVKPPAGWLEGAVLKGLLLGAEVTVSRWHNGAWAPMDVVFTDDHGRFLVEVGDNDKPLKLSALTVTGTRMVCDMPSLCSGTSFGQALSMPAGIRLDAILPGARSGEFVTVSPLTHLAAAWVESLPLGPDNHVAQVALTRIADLFYLPPEFVWTAPAVITASDSLESSSASQLRHGWLAAAMGEAMVNAPDPFAFLDAIGATFSDALGQLDGSFLRAVGEHADRVSLVVEQRVDHAADLATIVELVSSLKSTPLGHSSLGLRPELDAEPARRAIEVIDTLAAVATEWGFDQAATLHDRYAQQLAWLTEEDAVAAPLETVMDAMIQALIVALVVEGLDSDADCAPMADFASVLVDSGQGNTYPVDVFDWLVRPSGYVTLCPQANGAARLLFSTMPDPEFGNIEVNLGIEVVLLSEAGVSPRRMRIKTLDDPVLRTDEVDLMLRAPLEIELRLVDPEQAKSAFASIRQLIREGRLDSALRQPIRDLHVAAIASLDLAFISRLAPMRRIELELNASATLDGPAFLSGQGSLLDATIESGSFTVRGESGSQFLALGVYPAPGVLSPVVPMRWQLGRTSSLLGGLWFSQDEIRRIETSAELSMSRPAEMWANILRFFDSAYPVDAELPAFNYQGGLGLYSDQAERLYPQYRFDWSESSVTVFDVLEYRLLEVHRATAEAAYIYDGDGGLIATLRWFCEPDGGGIEIFVQAQQPGRHLWQDRCFPPSNEEDKDTDLGGLQ